MSATGKDFNTVIAGYKALSDEELAEDPTTNLSIITELYKGCEDYVDYKAVQERLVRLAATKIAKDIDPLATVNDDELDELRHRLWQKDANLGHISTTTTLSTPIVDYNYSSEVLEVNIAEDKEDGLRASTPDFLKHGLLRLRYTPTIANNVLTTYDMKLQKIRLRNVPVVSSVDGGLALCGVPHKCSGPSGEGPARA